MEKKLQKISYILQFIDSATFMVSSLSNLVNNLSEGIYKTKFSEYLFFLKSESTVCFLQKSMEKTYFNLHFKFHDFFP